MTIGRVNPAFRLDDQGITGLGAVHYNLIEPALLDAAVQRGEGRMGLGGAFLVSTGTHTGRSPKDKHVVRTPSVEKTIWWENNAAQSPEGFERLYADMLAHMQGRDYFVQDLYAGADPSHRLDVRVVTELAWHGLFIRHLLRRPERAELDGFTPDWTIINCPSFKADPARHGCRSETIITFHFDRKLILIGGTAYAGENKKSVFTLLNYLLPEKGVMPMHCSANHAPGNPVDTAVFFGLSGTGKTTLSADPGRTLIGDDEHGWSDRGTFNFEGGCYAKTINLSAEAEPEIYATTHRFGTVVENMVYDPETLELDFEDASLTANTRCAYPLDYISNASGSGLGGHPKNIIMLTCDAFGVLPADRAADPGAGDVSLPVGLHLQGGGHRTGRDRAAAHLLHLLRRAVHAAPPRGLWQAPAGQDRQTRRDLLAGEHRLDRRRLRHGPPDADPGDPRAADGGAGRLACGRGLPARPELRLRGAGGGAGRGCGPARPARHLGQSGGL